MRASVTRRDWLKLLGSLAGGTSKHLACGEGHANIPEPLRILRDGGYRGWIMVDAWEIPDPYDACLKAKRMLDAAL